MSEERATTRAEAQRKRILDAAQRCFIEYGFHAASMANIADAAGMSAGLIYRYFASKNEIILAIIEQQLQLTREEMRQLDGSVDLPLEIWRSFGRAETETEDRMNPVLFLEISAQASRDPEIAAAVHASEKALRTEFGDWLGRSRDQGGLGIPAERTEALALLLQCLVEGLKVREVREPDLDRTVLKEALRTFLPAPLTAGETSR